MSTLAGQFAGILLATVPDGEVEACLQELAGLEAEGLRVIAHASSQAAEDTGGEIYFLDLVGHDRQGIVQDITRILLRHGVNVEELETEVASASMAGGPLFKARARLRLPAGTQVADLEDDLEAIANELMVEFGRDH